MHELNHCGFYYREMSGEEAVRLVGHYPPGHFIIRDSTRPEFYFSLTFKSRDKQIYNVRVAFSNGAFYFVFAEEKHRDAKHASTVCELIQYYVNLGEKQGIKELGGSKLYLQQPIRENFRLIDVD